MEKENVKVYETKLGCFRAVPTDHPELYSIEKKYIGIESEDWIAFGLMKLKEFHEFIKANQK